MNNSIINIIDYVIQNYEHLNTIEMCQVLINKYDIEITDSIVDYIENNYDYIEHENSYNKNLKHTEQVKCIEWQNIKKLNVIENIVDDMFLTNETNFGYDLFPYRNKQSFCYTVYNSINKSEYKWHTDYSKSPMKDIKLTGIINLSTDTYEGGEFQINNGEKYTVKEFSKGGDIILFKSHLLHRVLPIKKGVRKILAFFFEGLKFR